MYRGRRSFGNKRKRCKEAVGDNPILQAFRCYSKELDDKHERYERIVKLSRDITIESKRIIFLLHTMVDKKDEVVEEANQRLQKLIDNNLKAIAKDMGNLDPYQYKYAYSPGLQELIEAYTFMEYLRGDNTPMSDWIALQKKLVYSENVDKPDDGQNMSAVLSSLKEEKEIDATPVNDQMKIREWRFFVDPTEYILGLADVTGELMRRCINCLGSGETKSCEDVCKTLQNLYAGYVSLNGYRCRELSRKIFTMHQSVIKVENVCYNVKVRGGEAAKWGTVTSDDKPGNDVDEGFF